MVLVSLYRMVDGDICSSSGVWLQYMPVSSPTKCIACSLGALYPIFFNFSPKDGCHVLVMCYSYFLFVLYVVMCCEQRIFLAMQGAGAYCMCAKKVAIHRARATARPPGRGRYSTVFILYLLLVLLLVPSLHFLFHCLIKRKVGNMNTTFLRYTK